MALFDPNLEVSSAPTPVEMSVIWKELQSATPGWTTGQREYAFALIAIETGNGKKLVANNVGNLSAGGYVDAVEVASWKGKYWRPPWYDESGNLQDEMVKGKVPSAFRAYDTLSEGVAGFVALLNSKRFEPLRAPADADDASRYVTALHDTGYSKDYGSKHVATFRSMVDGFRRTLGTNSGSGDSSIVGPVFAFGLIVAMVGVGFAIAKHGNR